MSYAGKDLVPKSPVQDEESVDRWHWKLCRLKVVIIVVVVVVADLCASSLCRRVSACTWWSPLYLTVTTGVP